MMNTTMTLLSKITKSTQKNQPLSARASPAKISVQRNKAENSYRKFTSLTKNEQLQQMRKTVKIRNPEWKHDYYHVNNSFNVVEKEGVDNYPHNNDKYNIQFSKQHLECGGGLNFTCRDNGFFVAPRDRLYSKHYIPIVKEKRKYNEDYLLRTSMFGKTWVDEKRERIMDEYHLQANPFSTQKSNELICLMRPARKHRFS